MVISVLERRSEIGLRRALGATQRHVGTQFLTESLLLAALGGVAGTLLGRGRDRRLRAERGVDRGGAVWSRLAGACWCAVVAGGVAGLYPALRAARLSPTDAPPGLRVHTVGRPCTASRARTPSPGDARMPKFHPPVRNARPACSRRDRTRAPQGAPDDRVDRAPHALPQARPAALRRAVHDPHGLVGRADGARPATRRRSSASTRPRPTCSKAGTRRTSSSRSWAATRS